MTSLCLFSFSSEEGRFGFGVDGFDREAEVVDVCWIDGERVAVSRATYIQCPSERNANDGQSKAHTLANTTLSTRPPTRKKRGGREREREGVQREWKTRTANPTA